MSAGEVAEWVRASMAALLHGRVPAETHADPASLSISALKAALNAMGVAFGDCIKKHEIVERLRASLNARFASLNDDLLDDLLDALDLASLHAMALTCRRHAAHARPLLNDKVFGQGRDDDEEDEGEEDEEDEDCELRLVVCKKMVRPFRRLPAGHQWKTKLQMGTADNNIDVRMRTLGDGLAQIYVGLFCDSSGNIEVQATVRFRFNTGALCIDLESCSDRARAIIELVSGRLWFVDPGQTAYNHHYGNSVKPTISGDLLWDSDIASDSQDGAVLLRLTNPHNSFTWLPPGGVWSKAHRDHRSCVMKDDLVSTITDGFESERNGNPEYIWFRDVRSVCGLESLFEQDNIIAQLHDGRNLMPQVLKANGVLTARRSCRMNSYMYLT